MTSKSSCLIIAYPKIKEYLNKAEKVIMIEGNFEGQLANLIQLETGFEIKQRILKYNGMAFFTEELIEKIEEEIA